jgi:hypothetical protein
MEGADEQAIRLRPTQMGRMEMVVPHRHGRLVRRDVAACHLERASVLGEAMTRTAKLEAERDKAFDDGHRALLRLSSAMDKAKDRRRYGVNCAISVLEALRDGRDVTREIMAIINSERPR